MAASAAAAAALPLLGAATAAEAAPRAAGAARRRAAELFYTGTWKGTQIYGGWFDPVRGTMTRIGPLAEVTANWAAAHPSRPVLYVAGGEDGGVVHVFRVDRATGGLAPAGEVHTDGGGTAGGGLSYIGVDRRSDTLLVANFEAGLAASLPIARDGGLGSPVSVVHDTGSGPNPRQAAPHPHEVVVDPSGTYALVADFGADRVFAYRYDRSTGAMSYDAKTGPRSFATAPGSGPRRLVFHPNRRDCYLLNELTADLQALHWNPRRGRFTNRQILPLDSPGFEGAKSGAELAISRDGRFVYASSRGENTLVAFSVDRRTGLLRLVQRVPCGGVKPWSFTLHESGRWMFVANQVSGTVNLFAVDRRSGRLTDTGRSLSIPSPDGITFC
ncbi:lactonase family protein [Actinomadura darangshiensis]|uniref:Lactonase family protein n=2 Tax=Actinomadura darangshiensis TaxID=705336 RepID=A0A4R5BG53_9ACTN|nr:lactonase family protein [Actinomadura darangshiensis]